VGQKKIETLKPIRVTDAETRRMTLVRDEELLYHVTSDDSVLGSVERSVAHRDQILHRSGMIFLIRSDSKILLQHRSAARATFPGSWDSSSSFHVTFGESYEQAAERELTEETGVSTQPTYLGKFSYHVPPENEVVAVFSCYSDDPVKIDQAESSEASFHTRDEVDAIAASEAAAPWLREGWKILADSTFLTAREKTNRESLIQ
jgi:isopentenyldiphosphate isomerase